MWVDSYCRNWLGICPPEEQTPTPVTRASNIGRPLWLQAIQLPHIQEQLRAVGCPILRTPRVQPHPTSTEYTHNDQQTHRRFHTGHVLEAEVVTLMRHLGLTITDAQTEVTIAEDPLATGHCDGVIHWLGERYVFDVKTMSRYSYESYVRNPHDNGGYISQLACYHHLLGTDGAFLLCYNKDTSLFRVVFLDDDEMSTKWSRAVRVPGILASVQTLEDLDRLPRPPAVPYTYRNKVFPGVHVAHPSMMWEPERHLLWNIERAKVGTSYRDVVVGNYESVLDGVIAAIKSQQE